MGPKCVIFFYKVYLAGQGNDVREKKIPGVLKVSKRQDSAKKTTPERRMDSRRVAVEKCSIYGLVTSIDQVCSCVDFCDIICCGEQIKRSK